MDKTRMKLATFFDQDDEESNAIPQKPLDNQKLNQYAQGTVRKSRREKEKDAADAKRREEEENAARAYAEFVDAFEGDGAKKKAAAGFVRSSADSGGVYAPAAKAPGGSSSRPTAMFERDAEDLPMAAPKKGKRAMDAFLDEIKRDQADREARYSRHGHVHGKSATAMAAYEGQSGSKDRGDPETSNLFVANLPPHVTESSFGQFFARYGPVGSLKIMWPRTDGTAGPGSDMNMSRRSKNSGMSGFVSFMKRKDAEAALRELDGFDWGGSVLRVGWSKAVSMSAKPLYTAKRSKSRSLERPFRDSNQLVPHRRRSRSRSRSRDRRDQHGASRRHRSYSRSRSPSHRHRRSRSPGRLPQHHGRSRSRSPRRRRSGSRQRGFEEDVNDTVSDAFVRTVAAQVRGNDASYEDNLRERERSNVQYAFLTDDRHRKFKYYKSLVDRHTPLRPEFDDDGYNSVYSTDSAEESERDHGRKNELGHLARRRFQAMLRTMSGKRGEMARCMAFSLEHAEAASEVADIIVASLLVDSTAVPRKLSRLHLICDILHNSAVPIPGAWRFRQEFQARLGLVFDHFASIYYSFPGRITADTFKKQITSVVDVWEDWIVFSPEFTADLRARLEGSSTPAQEEHVEEKVTNEPLDEPKTISKFKASSFKPAEATATAEELSDGEPMDEGSDSDGAEAKGTGKPVDDVDGVQLDDDLDGAPVDDLDGAPIDDLDEDGVDSRPAMEDIDGEAMDEDVDGAPVDV